MLSVSTQIAREDDLRVFAAMLDSVSFASHLTIYNFGRSDEDFAKIVKRYNAKLVEIKQPFPTVVEAIRSREVNEANNDWVLIMDFDEIITDKLKEEILTTISLKDAPFKTYAFRRRNFSLGYPLKYGGWGDDYVVRLFHKKNFVGWPTDIHSTPTVKGKIGKLEFLMEHHKDASLSQMIAKTNRYSAQEAKQFFEGGLAQVTPLTLIRKSTMEFLRRYFFKLGMLDGRIGLIQSLYQAFSVFVTYAKLYELQMSKK